MIKSMEREHDKGRREERERECTTNEERKYWRERFRVGSTQKGKY